MKSDGERKWLLERRKQLLECSKPEKTSTKKNGRDTVFDRLVFSACLRMNLQRSSYRAFLCGVYDLVDSETASYKSPVYESSISL